MLIDQNVRRNVTSLLAAGNSDFVDVSDVFLDAAEDMEQRDIILTEDFTLYDAMSALEIGNPRTDSGLIPSDEEARGPQFNLVTPLLPEEICYILDRVIACEMEWHAGYTLKQYTLAFMCTS
ncbi:Mak10 subunit, NatC N-terminal acetyltransferase-domain-containing protein [Russula aff. rugulosa BPL654]|nr:Mak10 subunit, NatC N-terminal acetyltransferase-domain-containing protein [Russula aff. rugulosa BPL654]